MVRRVKELQEHFMNLEAITVRVGKLSGRSRLEGSQRAVVVVIFSWLTTKREQTVDSVCRVNVTPDQLNSTYKGLV
jgi:hypothetical protein